MKVEMLYKFVMSKFCGEEAVTAEKSRTLWSPFFKYVVHKADRRNPDDGVGRYNSTKECLMDYLERKENVTHSRDCTAMEVWLGWLALAFELEEGYPDQFVFPKMVVVIF